MNTDKKMFDNIEEIIKDLKQGRMVIVVDDEDRENEGDLVMVGSFVRSEHINFMAKHGRGLICVPMEGERLDELSLYPMAFNPTDQYKTAWAISVDAKEDITTGISAKDRAKTVQLLSDPATKPADLIRPGHMFPLRSKHGGVLVRAGHTEACVDLLKLASLYPVGVICEIMNEDGTMARLPELLGFSKKFNLKMCSIASLIKHRRKFDRLVRRITEASIPTEFGVFKLFVYESVIDGEHHVALVKGDLNSSETLVRVHSQCLTGDVFGSLRCDCGDQLKSAMSVLEKNGNGVILYMRQEGRGIGLANKLKAYALQDKGLDTVEANKALGFEADLRDYGIGAQILVDMGLRDIKLMTNNPQKVVGLEGYGLRITEIVPIEVEASNDKCRQYLKTKKEKLGHKLEKV